MLSDKVAQNVVRLADHRADHDDQAPVRPGDPEWIAARLRKHESSGQIVHCLQSGGPGASR